MKYLLTFVVDSESNMDASPEEMKESMDRWRAFDREATEKGALIACEPLEAAEKTIEISDQERTVTDGPFAESKEQLGGFCLLECETLDEALEWANRVPMDNGAIEVRPIMDLSEFGYQSSTAAPVKAAAA
jgi:hypothetical protein